MPAASLAVIQSLIGFLWLQVGVPTAGKYQAILSSDDEEFGGQGRIDHSAAQLSHPEGQPGDDRTHQTLSLCTEQWWHRLHAPQARQLTCQQLPQCFSKDSGLVAAVSITALSDLLGSGCRSRISASDHVWGVQESPRPTSTTGQLPFGSLPLCAVPQCTTAQTEVFTEAAMSMDSREQRTSWGLICMNLSYEEAAQGTNSAAE